MNIQVYKPSLHSCTYFYYNDYFYVEINIGMFLFLKDKDIETARIGIFDPKTKSSFVIEFEDKEVPDLIKNWKNLSYQEFKNKIVPLIYSLAAEEFCMFIFECGKEVGKEEFKQEVKSLFK